MTEKNSEEKYVRVKDLAGNEFLCPLRELKDIRDATEEELSNCVEEAVVERYAGDIEVVE
jgi:hypothetical protein